MFQLTNQQTKINSFTPRAEKHGEENVLAGTLKCETTMHSSVLDIFDKGFRKLLYRKPAPGEQAELPLSEGDGLTARKLARRFAEVDESLDENVLVWVTPSTTEAA